MLHGATPGGLCVVGSVDGSLGFDSSSGQVGCVVVVVGDAPRRKNETPRGHSKYPPGVGGFRCPYPYPYLSVPLPTTPGGSLDPCPSLDWITELSHVEQESVRHSIRKCAGDV